MMDLSSWTDEDLRSGLAVIAGLRNPTLVKMGVAIGWEEGLHPRGPDGKFIGEGVELGRSIVDSIIHGMHDGMTQRSRATHLRVYHELKHQGLVQHANHYWKAVNNAKFAKQTIHPRQAFGKANYAIHTGDLSHLDAGPSVKPTKSVVKPGVPQFKIEKHFIEASGARNRIRMEGAAYLQTLTSADRAVIAKYTGTWYSTVNPELRTGVMSASERAAVEKLDHALRESKTSENTIVGRDTSSTVLDKIRLAGVGGVFQDPAFVSTGMRKGAGEGHGYGSGIQIQIPKGSPGFYVDNISKHQGEDEFLLPRESEFEIIKVGTGSQQSDYLLRYIGSNKAVNRPDVAASLTEVKVEVLPVAISAAHLQGQSAVPMPKPPSHWDEHNAPVVVDPTPASVAYPFNNGIQPMPLESLIGEHPKKMDGPHGSQPGQWYQHGTASLYVKPMSASRAINEVGSQRAYQAMGASAGSDIPYTWIAKTADGQYYVVSSKIEGLSPSTSGEWQISAKLGGDATEKAKKLWAADALLSHWDVAGLEHDNLALNSVNGVTRIDAGGAMRYRAQGSIKENWQPGGVGWVEPWSMRGVTPPGGGKVGTQTKNIFGRMTNSEAADALHKLQNHMEVDGGLESMVQSWMQIGMSAQDIAFNKAVIEGRLAAIPGVIAQLKQQPGLMGLPGSMAA